MMFFALHLPDGFLPPSWCLVGWLLAAMLIARALKAWQADSDADARLPMVGVVAAAIFAAQTLQFPVAGGSTGHLLGAALAAIMLGPWTAVLAVAAVNILQGLLFQDGGLLSMGWNLVNMAGFTTLTAAVVYRLLNRGAERPRTFAVAAAAAASVLVGSVATALVLCGAGASAFKLAVGAMLLSHIPVAAVEAAVTVSALGMLVMVRPALLKSAAAAAPLPVFFWWGGLWLSLTAVLSSPLAR